MLSIVENMHGKYLLSLEILAVSVNTNTIDIETMINLFVSLSTFNEFEGGISCSLLVKVIDCNCY